MAYITLNKNKFFKNLDIIAKQTKTKDKIALVLKDNAYGHGLEEVATMAHEYGIKNAVVQLESEAQKIEGFFEYLLILADIPQNPHKKFVYVINDLKMIANFPAGSRVELKVNTGMNRNGIEMGELRAAFIQIKKQGLALEAVLTHHGCADEENGLYEIQKENFAHVQKNALQLSEEFGFEKLRFHSSNSAALFREDDFCEDIARVGIAAYGCLELPWHSRARELEPILSLYANKISSRKVMQGGSVGYGAHYKVTSECFVSTYDFGYGAGFLRACSLGYTTPQAKNLVGRISMDNASFHCEDDEILIFDDAREIAKSAKTISYEVLTALKPHLKRSWV
jgi:alanine racemase